MNEQIAQHQPPRVRRASASQHGTSSHSSAGHEAGLHPEDRPYLTDERRPKPARPAAPRPRPDDDEEGDEDRVYDTRSHSSVRRYAPAVQAAPVTMRVQYRPDERVRPAGIPARSSRSAPALRPLMQPEARPQQQDHRRGERRAGAGVPRLLLIAGVGLLIMLMGWTLLTALLAWWSGVQDDWHYGYPRVERVTAVVGHADSAAHPSLFFAINDDGHAQVIECPGGNCEKAKIYRPSCSLATRASLPSRFRSKISTAMGSPICSFTWESRPRSISTSTAPFAP